MAIDHIQIEVPKSSLEETVAAYLEAFQPLGYKEIMRFTTDQDSPHPGLAAVGLGVRFPDFWIVSPEGMDKPSGPIHFAMSGPTRKSIRQFHDAALKSGKFTDNGKAGLRPEYTRFYYAAFVKDMHGNRVEVVSHWPGSADAIKTFVTSTLGGLLSLAVGTAAVGYYFLTNRA